MEEIYPMKLLLDRLEPEAKQALYNFAPQVFAELGWASRAAAA